MENSGANPRIRDPQAHDAKATPVRIGAGLVLGPLLVLDLVRVALAGHDCGPHPCHGGLTGPPAVTSVAWLVGVVALLIALFLPNERRFRGVRAWVLAGSAVCAVAVLGTLTFLPLTG